MNGKQLFNMINVTKTKLPSKSEYYKYLDEIWENNWITNDGMFCKKLERDLQSFLKVNNITLLANGTLSLQIAYKLLDLKGEVITTPFTFPATTNSLIWEGLTPVFADIDSNTFNIDPYEVESKITPKTSAIVAVHVFGNPCDVEALEEIAKKYNLKLIIDSAHAFGIKYKDSSIFNWGDINALSFHATKTFHTIEGGAVIARDKKLKEKIKLLSNHGIKTYEEISLPGTNARMNEFEASMGLCLLKSYSNDVIKRKKIYELYKSYFQHEEKVKLQKLNENLTYYTYPYFPILFDSNKTLIKVKNALQKNSIIARRYFYPPLNKLEYLKNAEKLNNAEIISNSILCLPLYADLSLSDAKKIIGIIKKELN